MVSVGISNLRLTDLIFVHMGVTINGGAITRICSCRSSCCSWCATTCEVISSSFNKTAHLHTGHATLYDFLSSQHTLLFLQICGRRIAPTLIRSTVDYKVRGDIQQRMHQLQLHSIDELKKRLHGMDHSVITPPLKGSGVLRSVCMCVCSRAYLWNRWTDRHESFVAVTRSSSGGVAIPGRRLVSMNVGDAVDKWQSLRARIQAKGWHFEQLL